MPDYRGGSSGQFGLHCHDGDADEKSLQILLKRAIFPCSGQS
jgi:hypothetical protein